MKRTLRTIVIFGVIGALVNVAIAWAFAMRYGDERGFSDGWQTGTYYFECESHEVGDPVGWVGEPVMTEHKRWGATVIYRLDGGGEYGWPDYSFPEKEVPTWVIGGSPAFIVESRAYGWPFRSFAWHAGSTYEEPWTLDVGRLDVGFATLPLIPMIGLIANTVAFGTSSWLLTLGPSAIRRAVRYRRGLCLYCGYDSADLHTCPECGQ